MQENMNSINCLFSYPEVKSISEQPKKLVILLHGYGSNGDDMISLAPFMKDKLPTCYFISPHGLEPFELSSKGRQWFSLINRIPSVLRQKVDDSSKLFQQIILKKQEELGLTNKDTIIVGFSQGTMLGLYSALTQDEPFAAVIGFSGLLVYPIDFKNNKTPVCLIHGENDTVVHISEMTKSIEYLNNHCVKYETLSIPNLNHTIDSIGIDKAVCFIQKHI